MWDMNDAFILWRFTHLLVSLLVPTLQLSEPAAFPPCHKIVKLQITLLFRVFFAYLSTCSKKVSKTFFIAWKIKPLLKSLLLLFVEIWIPEVHWKSTFNLSHWMSILFFNGIWSATLNILSNNYPQGALRLHTALSKLRSEGWDEGHLSELFSSKFI